MVGGLLGKGQRVAHQPGHTLPHGVVEPFDVIGLPRQRAHRFVLRRGNHLRIHHILICTTLRVMLMPPAAGGRHKIIPVLCLVVIPRKS